MKLELNYQDFVSTYKEGYKTALYYPEVLKFRKRNLNIPEIEKIIKHKVPKSALYSWINYNRAPLAFKDFKSLKKKFSNRDLEYLAVIVGHILGDGGISEMRFLHYCNTEKFLVEEFREAMKRVFGAEKNIRRETSGIMRLSYARKFSRALISLLGKFAAGGESKKITPRIEKMPLWWKIKVLQALYNDDGSVPKTETYVALKQKDKNIILWVQKILDELGINSGLTEDNSRWLLRIAGYQNLLKFRDKVNFSPGYRKQFQLDQIIEKIRFPHWETKNKIVELLKRGVKIREEIANELKMDRGVIYGHLHGWKRRNRTSTPGLVDLELVKVSKLGRINLYYI